jgi:serine/threonine protein kinase/Tol biopolymer transport system component
MPFERGTRLGVYEVIAPIGAGAMGEVYRARDTRLNRDIALKVLPAEFAANSERLAWFEREARLLAALNHPNIAMLFGVDDFDGVRALAMELVVGPTLAERIVRSPIPIKEILELAKQIAAALEAAHQKGVVHRDLKPENIKIPGDGLLKILDFGIAKVLTAGNHSAEPSATTLIVRDGDVVGTPAYMSPEQARGLAVDTRTDIWAFGCVLYEMLTRRRPFGGRSRADVIAAVLEREPDWNALPTRTPVGVEHLLRQCLHKDPQQRLRDIGDARLEIGEALDRLRSRADEPRRRGRFRRVSVIVSVGIGLLLAIGIGVGIRQVREEPPSDRPLRFDVFPPDDATYEGSAKVAPDGTKIAFAGKSRGKRFIWIRSLDAGEARLLPETEGGSQPFWSPDSRSLGFFVDGKLKRIGFDGAPAIAICDISDSPNVYTATWNAEGTILFGAWPRGGIWRVSAGGARPRAEPLLDTADARNRRFPEFLPDGRHYLYLTTGSRAAYVGTLDSDEHRPLSGITTHVIYSPSGHLLFMQGTALMAQRFDARRLVATDDPILVLDAFTRPEFVDSVYSVSRTGTLVYRPISNGSFQMAWFNRVGRQVGLIGGVGEYWNAALSPDGRDIAFQRGGISADIWVMNVEKGSTTRFSSEAQKAVNKDGTFSTTSTVDPIWAPDGRAIAFVSGMTREIYTRPFGAVGADRLLFKSGRPIATLISRLWDWSHDGRYIAYTAADTTQNRRTSATSDDIWALRLDSTSVPLRVTATPYNETRPRFSPDGHWIAYESDESGQPEVYIQPFPLQGAKKQLSAGGGTAARWSRDGKELFYLSLDLTMMAVRMKATGEALDGAVPVTLFQQRDADTDYTVAGDGRFLMRIPSTQPTAVVVNWASSLQAHK